MHCRYLCTLLSYYLLFYAAISAIIAINTLIDNVNGSFHLFLYTLSMYVCMNFNNVVVGSGLRIEKPADY